MTHSAFLLVIIVCSPREVKHRLNTTLPPSRAAAGGEKGLALCAVASDSGRPGRRRMDWDPELDVSLSNGRRVVTFQIAAVAGAGDAWAVLEPGALRRVILGRAAALATRQRVDLRIATRLAAGWVPVDGGPGTPRDPLPPDLVLQIS